jgi:hypothetical protein
VSSWLKIAIHRFSHPLHRRRSEGGGALFVVGCSWLVVGCWFFVVGCGLWMVDR